MTSLFASLQAAAACAVKQDGYNRKEIVLDRWATTYRCSPEQVDEALKIAENGTRKLPEELAATCPPVAQEEEPEG
jgi:hypothetical protein